MPFSKGRAIPPNAFLETLAEKFDGSVSNFVLGNAQTDKNFPIVYCSDGFCQLTGFTRSELMRRSCSCNFLIGLDTRTETYANINNALSMKSELKTEILFYKKTGAPFWCLLDILPIKNENGQVVLFLVSHKDVTKSKVSSFQIEDKQDEGLNHVPQSQNVPKIRKFSRDVLVHLQRHYQNTRDRPQAVGSGKKGQTSRLDSLPSYRTQYTSQNVKPVPRYIILHFGRPRLVWDWIILSLVFYIAVMVPFTVAFTANDVIGYVVAMDVLVEIFFAVDIAVNFRTTHIDKKTGQLVTNLRLIARRYLHTWFVLDFVAVLPYDLLFLVSANWASSVNLLKLCRLLRMSRAARQISRYTEQTLALLALLIFSFALLGHWLACIWYLIGCGELHEMKTEGWLYTLGEQMNKPYSNDSRFAGPSIEEAYVSSLYFVLTSLTTVGFGNIAPNTLKEKMFSIAVLFIGALMQSAIFGNMTAVIQKLYAARAKFHSKSEEVKQFVRINHIEGELRRRIEDYFLTNWGLSKGVDTEEILASFPIELQADICLHLYSTFLNLPPFQGSNLGFRRSLSLKVKRAHFTPGETVLKELDAVNALYLVQNGTIEVVQKDSIVAILGAGDTFGEDIFKKCPNVGKSNGDVKALTYCNLLYVTKESLCPILNCYPEVGDSHPSRQEMTFNLSVRRDSISRSARLDSIIEGEEERFHETESSEDETASLRTRRSTYSSSSLSPPPGNCDMPLWQRQIRHMETADFLRPADATDALISLESRLRQIEDVSSQDGDSVDASIDHKAQSFDGRSSRRSKTSDRRLETSSLRSSLGPSPFLSRAGSIDRYNSTNVSSTQGDSSACQDVFDTVSFSRFRRSRYSLPASIHHLLSSQTTRKISQESIRSQGRVNPAFCSSLPDLRPSVKKSPNLQGPSTTSSKPKVEIRNKKPAWSSSEEGIDIYNTSNDSETELRSRVKKRRTRGRSRFHSFLDVSSRGKDIDVPIRSRSANEENRDRSASNSESEEGSRDSIVLDLSFRSEARSKPRRCRKQSVINHGIANMNGSLARLDNLEEETRDRNDSINQRRNISLSSYDAECATSLNPTVEFRPHNESKLGDESAICLKRDLASLRDEIKDLKSLFVTALGSCDSLSKHE